MVRTAQSVLDPVVAPRDVSRAERAHPTPPSQLTPQARDHHERLIRRIQTTHGRVLLAIVLRFTGGDRQWAEDVVQETMLRAWRHAHRLHLESESQSLIPWLATTARRIVINDLRHRRARPAETDGTALEFITVHDRTEQVLARQVILNALRKLTPAHRQVIVEVHLRGGCLRELAQALGVPHGTVKSRVYYAMRAMRAELDSSDVQP